MSFDRLIQNSENFLGVETLKKCPLSLDAGATLKVRDTELGERDWESKNRGIGKSVALLKEQVCYFKLFKLTLLCPTRVLSLAALGLCPYGGLSVFNNICIVFCIRQYLDIGSYRFLDTNTSSLHHVGQMSTAP